MSTGHIHSSFHSWAFVAALSQAILQSFPVFVYYVLATPEYIYIHLYVFWHIIHCHAMTLRKGRAVGNNWNAVSQDCESSGGKQKGRDLRGLFLTATSPEEGRVELGMGHGRSTPLRTADSRQSLNPAGTLRSKLPEEEEGTAHLGKPRPLPLAPLVATFWETMLPWVTN